MITFFVASSAARGSFNVAYGLNKKVSCEGLLGGDIKYF